MYMYLTFIQDANLKLTTILSLGGSQSNNFIVKRQKITLAQDEFWNS